jgi:hypothetical protein
MLSLPTLTVWARDLGMLAGLGLYSEATAVNDEGQVVGYSEVSGGHARGS